MIYARPGQTVAAWKEELTRALGEQQGHMSLYQLTIEPETRYFDLFQAGKLMVPDEDHAAALYELTQELTDKAGLNAYEVSNHAKAGHESRHNLTYWRYFDYAGVGPGAHGRVGGHATACIKHPETWLQAVENKGHGLAEDTALEPSDQAPEYLLMGMRITEGIDLVRHAMLSGKRMDEGRIKALELLDLVARDGTRLYATPRGRPVLNAIIRELHNG